MEETAGLVRTRGCCLSWRTSVEGSLRLRVHTSAKSLGIGREISDQGRRA